MGLPPSMTGTKPQSASWKIRTASMTVLNVEHVRGAAVITSAAVSRGLTSISRGHERILVGHETGLLSSPNDPARRRSQAPSAGDALNVGRHVELLHVLADAPHPVADLAVIGDDLDRRGGT